MTAPIWPITSDAFNNLPIPGRSWYRIAAYFRRSDKVVLATKCYGATAKEPFQQGNSRKHIFDAVHASLRRLGTDYIDLYQLHRYDPDTPLEESLGALDDLVHMGKIRYAGCSNFPAFRLAKANAIADGKGLAKFSSVQPRYNLLYRIIERDLLELATEDGVGVIPYNPIAGGLLSGKHQPRRARLKVRVSTLHQRAKSIESAIGMRRCSQRLRSSRLLLYAKA